MNVKLDHHVPQMEDCEKIQSERAFTLLALAQQAPEDLKFLLQISALHLARAIPEYWYTVAELVRFDSKLEGEEKQKLFEKLKSDLEKIFKQARHYQLVTDLRRWDFHWEPLKDCTKFPADLFYRRGAPLVLQSGPGPKDFAGLTGIRLMFSGNGKQLGRKNAYEIQKNGFVESETQFVLTLENIIADFLEDMPKCRAEACEIPEIKLYFESPLHRKIA